MALHDQLLRREARKQEVAPVPSDQHWNKWLAGLTPEQRKLFLARLKVQQAQARKLESARKHSPAKADLLHRQYGI